ncbi:hypothetical protein ABZV60_26725 [Streptomyces sp. NPDC004787]|uniref:hypothetical protein n=1 Tax=Streptomyces sp. NPDC004787 TaxID=3154291 RepID=UPI0033BF0FE3
MTLALVAVSCSPGESGSQVEGLCGPSADSSAGRSLREVLGTDDFSTKVMQSDERFVREFKADLKEWQGGKNSTTPSYLCTYLPEGSEGRVVLDFAWSPTEELSRQRAQGGRFYDLNGASGRNGDLSSALFVTCDLGGELSSPSSKVLLRADAALTVNRGENLSPEREVRQLSFLYLMTREVTDVLGCENKPLKDEPVVKPLTAGAAS